jgi:flagellar L-ring protein precursor FlgH
MRAIFSPALCRTTAMLMAVNLAVACSGTIPDSIVAPAGARLPDAASKTVPPATNGTIFQAARFRPMFEDRRARLVGDTLIITISEKSTAGKTVASAASKDGAVQVKTPPLFGSIDLESGTKSSNADKASANAANNFNTTLSVTVTDVLANGNLLVRGEKQIALDRGTEFIRFSGLVNPATITPVNTVASTQVSDLRVEYRTNASIDKAALQSALARFFLSVLPL